MELLQPGDSISLDMFRSLVEESLTGVYLIQGERLVYCNPRLAEIFGYSRPEMLALGSVLARPGGDPEERCAILFWAATAEAFAGHWRKAREWREEALALARETEDKRLIASMLVSQSFTEFDLVSKSEGMDVAKTRTFGMTLDLGLWF